MGAVYDSQWSHEPHSKQPALGRLEAGVSGPVEVELVAVARTAVRRCDGDLAGWHPIALAAEVGAVALSRAGLLHSADNTRQGQVAGLGEAQAGGGDALAASVVGLDEVTVGCADPVGAYGADVARAIVLAAGWGDGIGGQVIDRAETSGLAALQAAAAAIASGQINTALVIGLGMCSVVPAGAAALHRGYGTPWVGVADRVAHRGGLLPGPRAAERAAALAGFTAEDLEAVALRSRRRRLEVVEGLTDARDSGPGDSTTSAIVPVGARPGRATGRESSLSRARSSNLSRGSMRTAVVDTDEIRAWDDQARLPRIFDDDGMLTAATFAGPADAMTAIVLRARPRSDDSKGGGPAARISAPGGEHPPEESGPAVLARLVGVGRAAGDPLDPTGAVAESVRRALATTGITTGDIEEIVCTEPDAATVLLCADALGLNPEGVNTNGGSLSTGFAGAAEELRLIADAVVGTQRDKPGHVLAVSAGPTGSAATLWQRAVN